MAPGPDYYYKTSPSWSCDWTSPEWSWFSGLPATSDKLSGIVLNPSAEYERPGFAYF